MNLWNWDWIAGLFTRQGGGSTVINHCQFLYNLFCFTIPFHFWTFYCWLFASGVPRFDPMRCRVNYLYFSTFWWGCGFSSFFFHIKKFHLYWGRYSKFQSNTIFYILDLYNFLEHPTPLGKFSSPPNFYATSWLKKFSTPLKFLYYFSDLKNFLQHLIIHITFLT